MREKLENVIKEVTDQLFIEGYDREYLIVEVSLRNLRKIKKDVNDYVRDKVNAWDNKELTRELFKRMESHKDLNDIIRMKYSVLVMEELGLILRRYTSRVKNSSDEVYWYPERACNLIAAFSYLNSVVIKDVKDDLLDLYMDSSVYDEFLEFDENEEEEIFDNQQWEDTTNMNLYPEYSYD